MKSNIHRSYFTNFPRCLFLSLLALSSSTATLAYQVIPKQKTIVWAATGHLLQKNPEIRQEFNGGFQDAKVMGTYLRERLGGDFFLISLNATNISLNPNGQTFTIENLPNSLEGKLANSKVDYRLIDTRDLNTEQNVLQPNLFLVPAAQFQAIVYIRESPPMIFFE